MYANAENIAALPQVLSCQPSNGPQRRRRIGPFDLAPAALDRFNHLLASLGGARPLDGDQIVTAARGLIKPVDDRSLPDCIAQRLGRIEPLSRMLADAAWAPENEALPQVKAVLAYVHGDDDLIPDWVPQVGRLDDAIVIEAAWPRISAEVLDYLDFCRLRELEAGLRGIDPQGFRFGRQDWEASRQAEAGLRQHQRRVREGSYLPAAVRHFRVH
jgi:uncharacterized membrane protein YkvA (DUF1232 family)